MKSKQINSLTCFIDLRDALSSFPQLQGNPMLRKFYSKIEVHPNKHVDGLSSSVTFVSFLNFATTQAQDNPAVDLYQNCSNQQNHRQLVPPTTSANSADKLQIYSISPLGSSMYPVLQ